MKSLLTLLFLSTVSLFGQYGGSGNAVQFRGRNITGCIPVNGQFYAWNSTANAWDCATNVSGGGGGGISTFDQLGGGTNVSATMTFGSGSAGTYSGTGILNANRLLGRAVTGFSGNGTALCTVTGSLTTGHIVGIDASGNCIDAGISYSTLSSSTSPAGGDVTGTLGALVVLKINGVTPAAVATSGSYTDLANKPTIPTVGATLLLLKGNNAGGAIAATPGTDYVTPAGNVATATAFSLTPTKCSSGFFPLGVDVSGNAQNCTAITTGFATVATSGAYSDLTGKPTLPTVATTALVLKGNGSGGAIAAIPATDYVIPAGNVATATALAATPSKCSAGFHPLGVDAQGNAASCTADPSGGGGGGASTASQLTDFQAVRTTSTQLTVGGSCSTSTPCKVRFGSMSYTYIAPAVINVSGGTGFLYLYISPSGVFSAGNTLGASCASGCTAINGITAFPPDSIPLYLWSVTLGALDASGGSDQRAFVSTKQVTGGAGIVLVSNQDTTQVSIDTSLVPTLTSVPATLADACSPGQFAANTITRYDCVANSVWKTVTYGASASTTVRVIGGSYTVGGGTGPAFEAYLGVDTSGARAITLPDMTAYGAQQTIGTVVAIKDETGGGASHTITITAGAGSTIDGSSSTTITTAYGFKHLRFVAACTDPGICSAGPAKWVVVGQ